MSYQRKSIVKKRIFRIYKCRNLVLLILILGIIWIYLFLHCPECHLPLEKSIEIERNIDNGRVLYDNPQLVKYLRKNFLIGPTGNQSNSSPMNRITSEVEQDGLVDKLLNKKRNGFFMEAGAYDGERLSNTLFFERERNWTGLLIEPNPYLFKILQSRRRNAYLSNTCISPTSFAITLNLTFYDSMGPFDERNEKYPIVNSRSTQCFPLTSYLLALSVNHIHYLSLDIGGSEYDILRQIDFKNIKIDVLSVTYFLQNSENLKTQANLDRIKQFILNTGLYHEIGTIGNMDIVFMRNPC